MGARDVKQRPGWILVTETSGAAVTVDVLDISAVGDGEIYLSGGQTIFVEEGLTKVMDRIDAAMVAAVEAEEEVKED